MGFYKPLTPEEEELNTAMDYALDSFREERFVIKTGLVLYVIGFPLLLIGGASSYGRVGAAMVICGALCMMLSVAIGIRSRRRMHNATELLNKYKREQALPFFNELTEMLADKDIHIHLEDNGLISIKDNREEKING